MVKSDIKSRIASAKDGTLFFSSSFPEFDDEYVGKVLSELVDNGTIHRLCRGVYLKSKKTRFGVVYPPLADIAKAIAERDQAQLLPTGATALNILGLSTQVPMNPIFITSGSARIVKIGERTITFRRAVPKNFVIKGDKRRLIVQALKAIGERNMTEDYYNKIASIIKEHHESETLVHDLCVMPVWIKKIFLRTLKVDYEENLANTFRVGKTLGCSSCRK